MDNTAPKLAPKPETEVEARQREVDTAHDVGEDCGTERCQECCAHDERDHGICLDCEHEEDAGAAIDRAMDYFEA